MENKITQLFLVCLALKIVLELWLDLKNRNHILKNKSSVPAKFSESISLEEHQKAADYTVAKTNTGIVFNLLSYAILLVWTLGGGINLLDNYVATLELSPILTGVSFLALFSLITTLIVIPQSLYQNFVLE